MTRRNTDRGKINFKDTSKLSVAEINNQKTNKKNRKIPK